MKKLRNFMCLGISFIMLLVLMAVPSFAANASKSWNMSNSNFRSLGTISSDTTIDGINLLATSEKTMSVISSSATYNSTTYSYALSLGGGGSTAYRAVSFDVSGTSTLKITAASSGSDTRYLKVVTASGTELGTIDCASSVGLGSISFTVTDKIYIYSTGSGINIYKIQLDTTGSLPGESSSGMSELPSTSYSTTVSTFNDLAAAAKTAANTSGGGTIYVDTSYLDCTSQLALSGTSGNPVVIAGVKQSNGTYPVLDFTSLRTSKVGSTGQDLIASGDASVGVRITGSNYTIANLIIEKAGDNGIQIKGSSANYNTVQNCISRYNNDAGVQITNGASYNSMEFVYSYRNNDVYTRGGNADGFAPKLGAGTGNSFYGCYAWENSDDGWDSYDKTDYTYDLTYQECATWNNGNPLVFTGEYDFNNGKALDTNLFLVELITKEDSGFASRYANGTFSLPTTSFLNTDAGTLTISSWASGNYDGNPNGFKVGSVNSGSDLTRVFTNCLAFDNASKGFDNNNSTTTVSLTNTVSFDNGYNYYLPVNTINVWSNIYGFSGTSNDKLPSGYAASTPGSSTQSSIRSVVDATVETIVDKCNNNIIPGEVYFNIY